MLFPGPGAPHISHISDVDSFNFSGGRIEIRFDPPRTDDHLLLRPHASISRSGPNVLLNGVDIATVTGGNGEDPMVITFKASAPTDAAYIILMGITYTSSADLSDLLTRDLQVTVQDGDGGQTYDTQPFPIHPAGTGPFVAHADDQVVEIFQGAELTGYLNKSVPVIGNGLGVLWTEVSQPAGGKAYLANPAAVKTGTLFSKPGTYVLRFTVSHGTRESHDDLIITVNSPPTVNIENPTPGQAFAPNASLTLAASAQVNGVGATISSVQFCFGPINSPTAIGPLISQPATSGFYQHTWGIQPVGRYAIYAKATDSAGRVGYSPLRIFQVGDFPTVDITAPTGDEILKSSVGFDIWATANVSSPASLSKVEFFKDDRLIEGLMVPGSAPLPFASVANSPALKPGSYTLMARATAKLPAGQELAANSAPVSIRINRGAASGSGSWVPIRGYVKDYNNGQIRWRGSEHPIPINPALKVVPNSNPDSVYDDLYVGAYVHGSGGFSTAITKWINERVGPADIERYESAMMCPEASADCIYGGITDLVHVGGELHASRYSEGVEAGGQCLKISRRCHSAYAWAADGM